MGRGDAGSVTINANDLVKFDGEGEDGNNSGATSQVNFRGVGNAGDVSITTSSLEVLNGAQVSANSFGQGNAGDVEIDARSIRLDNDGRIAADTRSADGNPQANINIRSRDLILSDGSNITANAEGEGVIGGNINIDTGVLAGFENSNITANSTDARGGNVAINTEGLFGIQFREEDSNQTNDITATGVSNSNEFIVNEENINIGLVQVPTNIPDSSNQIYDPCVPGNPGFGSSFVYIGRGGLPMTPTEPLQETGTISTWVRLKPQSSSGTNRNTTNRKTSSQPTRTAKTPKVEKPTKVEQPTQIVEATGWIVNEDGEIEFVAQANHTNPTSPWQNPASCSVSTEKEEGRSKK